MSKKYQGPKGVPELWMRVPKARKGSGWVVSDGTKGRMLILYPSGKVQALFVGWQPGEAVWNIACTSRRNHAEALQAMRDYWKMECNLEFVEYIK